MVMQMFRIATIPVLNKFLGALVLSALIPTVISLPARAIELGGGRTSFIKAPRLLDASASHKAPGAVSDYHFTIQVPENAGEPLQAVTIAQKEQTEDIRFNPSEISAMAENQMAGRQSVNVSSIGGMAPDENEVTVVFDEPVEPGSTVTVSLRARRNPLYGGVYQFGVTAFPVGDNSPGLYLGSARLHFEGSNN